jgi:NAD(P)-dependent dehydrogenase (short-subunit alcohol dehydrogenase family)
MQQHTPKKEAFPEQSQDKPGLESQMTPQPLSSDGSEGCGRLANKKCILTGGDSGIGRAVAIAFAKEGADVAILYLKAEETDALETAEIVENIYKKQCILIPTDISKQQNCIEAIQKITQTFSQIDVLVNNAAVQYSSSDLLTMDMDKMVETFTVNIFAMFWISKAVLPFMKEGSCIINTSSVTAYRGSGGLLDYSSTKGAIVSFTRSLSANLSSKGIRVNGVAPGPVWTPLITSTFEAEKVKTFGTDTPMGRAAQPIEIAPAYVFLASKEASYITGQFIHVNGGEIING